MITTSNEIKTEVLNRLGEATTTTFLTDTILNSNIRSAVRFATAYKRWPFSEGRLSTTFTGVEEWSFEGIKADTIRVLQIGGKRLQKLNFEDYQIFKEEYPSDDDRVYTDFGEIVLINPNVDLSGTLTAWFKYRPVDIDMTDTSSTTIFSNKNDEGNEAIVEETLSYVKTRYKKEQEALVHHQRAIEILERLWTNINDEQFNYHTHKARGGMWERIDVLNGGFDEDITRDQF